MSALYVFLRNLTALIYPTRCPVCRDFIGAAEKFCKKCESEFTEYSGNSKIPGTDFFTALYEYDEKISPAIITMKRGDPGNAPYAFGKLLSDRIKSCGICADLIVPVPMHSDDLKKRGFNQTELIAKYTGKFLGVAVCRKAVVKEKKTAAQKTLGANERRVNLDGAFSVVRAEEIRGRKIIIIDDVCTTGATLSELAATLRKSGAAEIYCACACKTAHKGRKKE